MPKSTNPHPKPRKVPKKCKCGGPPDEPHHCPYRNEISGDPEELCNCCPECTAKCGEEV